MLPVQFMRRPSTPPVAPVLATHDSLQAHQSVAQRAALPTPKSTREASVRLRDARVAGMHGSVRQIAGAGMSAAGVAIPGALTAGFTAANAPAGDVRGVPPRGRPV